MKEISKGVARINYALICQLLNYHSYCWFGLALLWLGLLVCTLISNFYIYKIDMASSEEGIALRKGRRAVYTFGRFQPPTLGHGLLYDTVLEVAAAEPGSDAYVFVSSSVNNVAALVKSAAHKAMLASCGPRGVTGGCFKSWPANENPLSVEQKIKYLQKMHSGKDLRFVNTTTCMCPTFYNAAEALAAAGYTEIVLLVGSDRVTRFSSVFASSPIPGVAVAVQSAGEPRKTASNGSIRGISGTFLRTAAVDGNFDTFKAGLVIGSMTDDDIKALMNDIRVGLGLPALAVGGRRRRRTRKLRRFNRRA